MSYRYTTEEDGLTLRRSWSRDCQTCPITEHCTTGKVRRITRRQNEHLMEDMARRLSADGSGELTRRTTVEHPFGTVKAWMDATHFQLRRLANVRIEMALLVLACKMKRMIAMVGIVGLRTAIIS